MKGHNTDDAVHELFSGVIRFEDIPVVRADVTNLDEDADKVIQGP